MKAITTDPSQRGLGFTTLQMRAAPRNSVFLWPPAASLGYASELARYLGRDDLEIVDGSIMDRRGARLRGRILTGITLDHAWEPDSAEQQVLRELRAHCIRFGIVGKYRVAYYVENGRRRRTRLGKFRSDAQAVDALKRFAEARAALVRAREVPTIGALWAMWLRHREEDGFSNVIYAANWVSLQPHFGHRRPETITDAICREYARGRFALGRSSWTVNTELARLRACLQWAASRWHIPRAPYVWVPSRGKGRKLVITADEAKRLIEAAIAPHIRLFVILALTTGARHTAILDLMWDRVDFDAGVVSYDEDLDVDPMSKSWRKGRASVPMNALSRAALCGTLCVQLMTVHPCCVTVTTGACRRSPHNSIDHQRRKDRA